MSLLSGARLIWYPLSISLPWSSARSPRDITNQIDIKITVFWVIKAVARMLLVGRSGGVEVDRDEATSREDVDYVHEGTRVRL